MAAVLTGYQQRLEGLMVPAMNGRTVKENLSVMTLRLVSSQLLAFGLNKTRRFRRLEEKPAK